MTLRLATCCLTTALAGCVSLSSVQTADTLGAGRIQVGIEPGVTGVASSQRVLPHPLADVSVRYGAFERLDLGARLGQSGLELQLKWMATPRGWPVLLSLAPFVGGNLIVEGGAGRRPALGGPSFTAGLPLLVGVRLGAHQLVLGPRVQLIAPVSNDPADPTMRFVLVGGSIGVALRVSRAVAVLPELAVLHAVYRTAAFPDGLPGVGATDGLPIQLRLGFLLGAPEP